MSDIGITLSEGEIEALTGYELATFQLRVLRDRGFARAYINRKGKVVLERTHYEAVTKGQDPLLTKPAKAANLSFLRRA